MVLCKFFQQGNCRFGSKCHNEHIDIKALVKADVQAAINGKQWPFSSFGPFKDKACIPNFIEDQSFEEVRYLCYESKRKNFFDQFHQQFTREALEATNKMKTLLQLAPDAIEIVSKVYDGVFDVNTGTASSATANVPKNPNNPFGMPSTGPAATTNSLFGKPALNSAANNNLFGGNFNTAAASGTASIFGGSANNAGTQSNIFGGGAGGAQHTPLFAQTAQQPTNSIFGGGQQNSAFAQNQNVVPGGNIFAQAPQSTPIATVGPFGQQMQQTPAASGFGLFSQPTQQPAPAFGQQNNVFAQTAQANQQKQQTQPQMQPSAGIFGQAAAAGAAQNGGNLFAQAAQAPPNAGGGFFGNAAPVQSQNIFGQAAAQMQNAPQQAPQQMQAMSTGIFAQAAAAQPPSGFFTQAMQQTGTPQAPFMQQPQGFGVKIAPAVCVSLKAYSRMEDLTPEEIEAFTADVFMPGKLPLNPPPRELC